MCLTDSDGQPDSRMQAWSPVQTSSSTPKRSRTMRSPSFTALSNSGFTRRCLLSMHSDEATMIFGPGFLGGQRLAQRVAHLGHVIGAVDLAHPFGADALHRIDDRSCWSSGADCRRARTGCPARRSPPNRNCRRSG